MTKRHLIIFLIIPILSLSSCSTRFKLKREDIKLESQWPDIHYNQASTGRIEAGNFQGHLVKLWEEKVSDKPTGPLTIYYKKLIIPASRKRIRFFDTETGKNLGRLRIRGIPQTGIVIKDSLSFFGIGYPKNKFFCLDLIHNDERWQVQIKDVSFGSIIVDDRLIMSSSDGKLTASDITDGHPIWCLTLPDKFLAPPSYRNGRLYLGTDRGQFYAVSAVDGKEIYHVNLAGPIVSAPAVSDVIYVTDVKGNVIALDPLDGKTIWQITLPHPIWTTPVISDKRVIIGTTGGDIISLDAASGKELWCFAAVDVVKASPIVIGNYVVVGTMTGSLLTLDCTNGSLVSKEKVDGAIAWSPVSDGSRVYVATQKGRIVCFGETNEQTREKDH